MIACSEQRVGLTSVIRYGWRGFQQPVNWSDHCGHGQIADLL